jgi:hypothetical protein
MLSQAFSAYAQEFIDARKILPRSAVFFSPRSATFTEGSTFDVPILLDTKGKAVNGIEVRINFDHDRLSIVKPSSGESIIGVWVEPPSYDNTKGTASYVGVVPNGITTDSGLIGTITFQAKKTGKAKLSVRADSNILQNDGLGTDTNVDLGRAEYTIIAKAPEGVQVFSDTHPIQQDWYNNHSPVFSWTAEEGVTGYSYAFDNKPSTIPDNEVRTEDTSKSFENVGDGLWYFHIKAQKDDVWGATGHYLVRIDTSPPALFTPKVEYVLAAVVLVERALVSFFTTDSLSGIDHYEIGVIDKSQPATESPTFVQTESPYQVPIGSDLGQRVIVRAVDRAGNVQDVSIDVLPPKSFERFFRDNVVPILLILLTIALILMILHFFWGHHLVRRLRKAFRIMHDEEVHAHDRDYERPIVAAPPHVNAVLHEQRQYPDTGAGNAGINLPQEYAPPAVGPVSSEQMSNTESYTEPYSDHTHSYQEPPPRT